MDFRLTDQEIALRDLARDFADRYIRPGLLEREWEPDPHKRMPWDIVEAGSEAGLRTLTVPPEYGGPEPRVTQLARALVATELGAADPGVATIFQTAMKDVSHIDQFGTKEQRDRFFAKFTTDPRHLTCSAITEPAHGSDVQFPYEDFHLDTTARLDGDEWVINGEKYTISNGAEAKTIILYAATDPSVPFTEGTSMFFLERCPGIEATQIHPKIGLRMVNSARIVFDNCRVPKSWLVGEVNGAYKNRSRMIGDTNLLTAAIELGITRSAFEESVEYARQRVQGGKPIIEHQAVGVKLGEICGLMEAQRSMVYRLAWMLDNPSERDPKFNPLLNWFAAEATYRATTLAMQVMGCGGGWMSLHGQKHIRDAMVYFPNEGNHSTQLLKVHNFIKSQAAAGALVR